jgi:hypothetical protein
MAFGVTGLVMISTMLVAVKSVFIGDKPDMTFIGQSLLPLWGTWVGTIIAFYFGKENFEAAARSYNEMIKHLTPEEKFAKIPLSDVMIPVSQIAHLTYDDKTADIPLFSIMDEEGFKEYQRIAFLTAGKVFKYIIHKSTFAMFVTEKYKEQVNSPASDFDPQKLKLRDILEYKNPDSRIPDMLQRGYGFVPVGGTLLDAKKIIDAIPECQDVFVTQTGKTSEPVLGLITNNMVLDRCRL